MKTNSSVSLQVQKDDNKPPHMDSWEESYFKNQPTRDLLFEGDESPVSYFGYKVRKGREIFTIVDWGNIKEFIRTTIASEVDKERVKVIEEIEKIVTPLLTGENHNKKYNVMIDAFRAGIETCLETIASLKEEGTVG